MENPYRWKKDRDSAFIKGDTVYLHSLLMDCKRLGLDSQFLFEMHVIKSTKDEAYLIKVKYVEKDSLFVSKLLENGLIHDRRVLVGVSNTDREDLKNLFEYIETEFNSSDYPDEADTANSVFPEGGKKEVLVNKYERSPEARKKCIEIYKARCAVCDMSFGETYGEFAEGFIHVHHIKKLSETGQKYEVDPKEDLRPVCPNCHAMLHRKLADGSFLSIEMLRKFFIEKN